MNDLMLVAKTSVMTPRIITYLLCGMRHPTSGLSEDDLSRLTGSSSSTASCGSNNNSSSSSSSSSPSSATKALAHKNHGGVGGSGLRESHHHDRQHKHHHRNSNHSPERRTHTNNSQQSPTRFTSTYLPEFINPLEWQKSRKRKERLDSTSTATQERKLQRSNSEELLPQESNGKKDCNNAALSNNGNGDSGASTHAVTAVKAADVIRRVCSEDFKKSASYAAYAQEFNDTFSYADNNAENEKRKALSDENNASLANRRQPEAPTQRATLWAIGQPTRDMARRSRTETSPARSQRFSPVRNGNNGSKLRDSDDSECEHERRRSSERFSKTRAPPGRKAAGVSKKSSSSKYLPSKRNDENVYKYDLSALKYERRGFVSKKGAANVATNAPAGIADHNDNNLIDFNNQQNQQQSKSSTTSPSSSIIPTTSATSAAASTNEENNAATVAKSQTQYITAQEALPWERAGPEDQAPVLSRRYGAVRNHPVGSMETAAKLAKVMPYPQPVHKQSHATQLLMDDDMDDDDDGLDTMDAYRAFTSIENLRTRELMQQVLPAMMSYQSPEERLKQVNKRLTALKKKLVQLEEAYEARMGYRPSQAERINDKYMKNVLAELSKLRKERHELKADPMGALGLKMSGGITMANKLEKMRASLQEIEQSLSDKRRDATRSEVLEDLNAEQLLQEKTAVQHGLLYFEQLYGRPTTKDERDVARPLYTRYRMLKRLVSRSVVVSGAPELPTILEHEPFESLPQQYSSNNSTETTNTPSDSAAPNLPSSDDSTTTTTTTAGVPTTTTTTSATSTPAAASTSTSNEANENVSGLSIEQLWEQLDKTREEKKLLKRTIREYETVFEEQNGRKMLKNDRRIIEETYAQYKEKKAKTRLLQALIKKQISR